MAESARDTLVVESIGFNGKFWLDGRGHPATEQLRVTERFTRPSFGRLAVEITIERLQPRSGRLKPRPTATCRR